MQRLLVGIGALASAGAIALLAACSSGGSLNPNGAAPSTSGVLHRSPLWRSGIASEYLGIPAPEARFVPSRNVSPDRRRRRPPSRLFIDNNSPYEVLILRNNTWSEAGTITNGTTDPDGNWYDKHGLYVANFSTPNIEQYNSKGSLLFTYSAGMSNPVTLTTDSHGNVFEADFTGDAVNEYHQGVNTVVASCQPGGDVEGVAVDASGDVFVAYYTGSGNIAEYKGGLSGCPKTTLGATVQFPGGMILDNKSNLLICDQTGDAVDIIKPPYGSISGTLGTGYGEPFHVSLNSANSKAYITDTSSHTIDVVTYPAGTRIATLGTSDGVTTPYGAVDGSNFIP